MLLTFGVILWSLPLSVFAGQILWTPGPEQPTLVLSLGDGAVKKTFDIPSASQSLTLTLKKFLLEDSRLRVVWKNERELWLSQAKKIPGDQTTEKVTLPPGRQITLEITTESGTLVAIINLRRK